MLAIPHHLVLPEQSGAFWEDLLYNPLTDLG